jgi:5-dehydro-2-deoxygluconokinase
VVLLGLEAPYEVLKDGFAAARTSKTVKGFAVGRTIFADAAKAWLAGRMTDEQAVSDMAAKFKALVDLWLQLGETKAA